MSETQRDKGFCCALEMAARRSKAARNGCSSPLGAAVALEMPARARLGAAGAFEMAARATWGAEGGKWYGEGGGH